MKPALPLRTDIVSSTRYFRKVPGLTPIRDRRRALARDPGYVLQVVKRGTARAREITDATLRDVRAALGLFTLN